MLVDKGAGLQVVWNVVQRNNFFLNSFSCPKAFFNLVKCLSACIVCCVLLSVSQVTAEMNIITVVIVVKWYIT
jgi:hypothetical protein